MSAKLGALNILLSVDTAQFSTSLRRAGVDTGVFAKKFSQSIGASAKSYDHFLKTVSSGMVLFSESIKTSFLKNYGTYINNAIQLADAFGQYSSRLKQATNSTAEYNAIASQLMDTSNRTFKSYEDAYELFIRTSGAMKQLGYSAQEVADLVSTVQFGLTVDSADSQKTQSAINAISGAILEGRLNMQKFNTIVAASPSLFQALADNIAGGSQQALRQMVASGQVTARELLTISNSMAKLGEQADEMPTTVADAMTKLRNEMAQFYGDLNEGLGISEKLVTTIGLAGNNMALLSSAALGAGTLVVANMASVQFAAKGVGAGLHTVGATAVASAKSFAAFLVSAQNLRVATSASIALNKSLTLATATAKALGATMIKLAFSPLGAALMVTAGAFALMSSNSKQASATLREGANSAQEYANALQKANKVTLVAEKHTLSKQLDEALGDVKAQVGRVARSLDFTGLHDSVSQHIQARIAQQEINALLNNNALSADQLSDSLVALADKWQQAGKISAKTAEHFMASMKPVIDARERAQDFKASLEQVESALQKTGTTAKATGNALQVSATQGMADWDKYVGTLQEAQATVGMTARQLAEFKARQAGANDAQAQTAGLIAAQTELYHQLKKAIEDGDSASQHRITHQLEGLTAERAALEGGLQAYSQIVIL